LVPVTGEARTVVHDKSVGVSASEAESILEALMRPHHILRPKSPPTKRVETELAFPGVD